MMPLNITSLIFPFFSGFCRLIFVSTVRCNLNLLSSHNKDAKIYREFVKINCYFFGQFCHRCDIQYGSVIEESGRGFSESPDEFVADVKDEYDQSILLPDLRTNLPAMKENQWFFLMGT